MTSQINNLNMQEIMGNLDFSHISSPSITYEILTHSEKKKLVETISSLDATGMSFLFILIKMYYEKEKADKVVEVKQDNVVTPYNSIQFVNEEDSELSDFKFELDKLPLALVYSINKFCLSYSAKIEMQ